VAAQGKRALFFEDQQIEKRFKKVKKSLAKLK